MDDPEATYLLHGLLFAVVGLDLFSVCGRSPADAATLTAEPDEPSLTLLLPSEEAAEGLAQ